MTTEIADAIEKVLAPRGVLVVIEAEHLCMSMRGVKKPGTLTVTSSVRGLFRSDVGHPGRGHAVHPRALNPPARFRGQPTAMPTIGLLRGWPPVEPKKPASPKVKMPPSEATSQ